MRLLVALLFACTASSTAADEDTVEVPKALLAALYQHIVEVQNKADGDLEMRDEAEAGAVRAREACYKKVDFVLRTINPYTMREEFADELDTPRSY